MKPKRHRLAAALAAIAAFVFPAARTMTDAAAQQTDQRLRSKSAMPIDDRALTSAICSVVYQVDRIASSRGYHYLFYGDGFFIDRDGYVLTAAHVLGPLHGGQPYLLIRTANGPQRFVQASVVAIDHDHDVAILRATPNPFEGGYNVSFLALDRQSPLAGHTVLAAAARPLKPRDSYTLDPVFEERSPGEVINFEFSQLEKGRADTELFLFSHSIQPGQSGAPVISLDSHGVAGFVEGQWLHAYHTEAASQASGAAPSLQTPAAASNGGPVPGAVVPIHYAIALLQQKGIGWHEISEGSGDSEGAVGDAEGSSLPAPFSLIPAAYPSQALFGGEVMLDALVETSGTLSDIKIVSGEQPFVEKALAAARTWTFVPARSGGHAAEARIAIAFQFPQPYVPPRSATAHNYGEGASAGAPNRAAIALATVEPKYPPESSVEGSVILYEALDSQGVPTSTQIVRGLDALTPAVLAAARKWRFAPARQSGAATESAAILVVTVRRPLVDNRATQ
jgi:TonB family protein